MSNGLRDMSFAVEFEFVFMLFSNSMDMGEVAVVGEGEALSTKSKI